MKFNQNIFKAYDIRGKFPEELNETIAEKIGRVFTLFLQKKRRKKTITILVAMDVRTSSPALKQSFIRGALAEGARILDAGVATTPLFYYCMHTIEKDGGIMITASHNPIPYNGFKFRDRNGNPISFGTGLEEIKRGMTKSLPQKNTNKNLLPSGTVTLLEDQRDHYIQFFLRRIRLRRDVRLAIDACGGSTTFILPRLLHEFPSFHYTPLFFEPDGTFAKHPPNPLLPEAQKPIKKILGAGGYRFGALFDGDGDRVVFFDERGEPISGEFVLALLASEELKKNPNAAFIFSVNTSRGAREYVVERGGKVFLSPVGYTFMSPNLRRKKAIAGSEISGHFYFKDFFNDDSGVFALLKFSEFLANTSTPVSRLIHPMRRYISSGEINVAVRDKKTALMRILKFYRKSKAKILKIDGITIEFPDWWVNIRPSNTEPYVRMVLEAHTQEIYDHHKKELDDLL